MGKARLRGDGRRRAPFSEEAVTLTFFSRLLLFVAMRLHVIAVITWDVLPDRSAFARVSLFQSMEAALVFAWPKYGPWVLDGEASYRMFTDYMDSRP
jgi:hypothetical protein